VPCASACLKSSVTFTSKNIPSKNALMFVDVRWSLIYKGLGKRTEDRDYLELSITKTIYCFIYIALRTKGKSDINRNKEKVSRNSTINDRRPARDDILLLNVGLLAGIFSTSPYVMERIRGVVSSGCEFLKKGIYRIRSGT